VLDHTGFPAVRGLFVSKVLEDGRTKKIIPGSLRQWWPRSENGGFEAASDPVAACN
jgi:hypothetical protein